MTASSPVSAATRPWSAAPPSRRPPIKRVQGGRATTDVVTSAHVGQNAELFAKVMALHVPRGALVADVTFGLGAFWRHVEAGAYRLLASDIELKPEARKAPWIDARGGVDCRALPYADASIDAVVLDPPYMEGLHRRAVEHMAGSGSHAAFRRAYSSERASEGGRAGTTRSSISTPARAWRPTECSGLGVP